MTNLLSFLNVVIDWDWFLVFPASISIFTNRIRDWVMATGTDGHKIIYNTFIRYLHVTTRPMMHLQLKARPVFIAQAATMPVKGKSGFAFSSPGRRGDVLFVGHSFNPIDTESRHLSGLPILSKEGQISQKTAAFRRQKEICQSSFDNGDYTTNGILEG
jgi:hypothetical protein